MAEDASPSRADAREKLRWSGGRDEMNLAEFPISSLNDRLPKGCHTLEFSDEIYDQAAGCSVIRKLTITAPPSSKGGDERSGLPTATDDEVIVALIQHTKLVNNFSDPRVPFSRYELLKLLGWADVGKNYKRLDESMKRWVAITLDYENAWWDNEAKAWRNRTFHIIDEIEALSLSQRRSLPPGSQRELALSWFRWSPVVFKSFQADNLKRLNLDAYFQLGSAVSKRMYRFLDKRFYHRRRWEFDLCDFAFEHVGLSRGYDVGKIKEKLEPALRELTEIGYLEPPPEQGRYEKIRKGEWRIALAQRTDPVKPAADGASPPSLAAELTARGVTHKTALQLVGEHDEARIRAQLAAFDWLRQTRSERVRRSPAGYLVKSIGDDYSPPEGYLEALKRKERDKKAADDGRLREDARKKAEEREAAAYRSEQERVRGYLESLEPDERARVKNEALARGNSFFVARYRDALSRKDEDSAKRHLDLILHDYVVGVALVEPPS